VRRFRCWGGMGRARRSARPVLVLGVSLAFLPLAVSPSALHSCPRRSSCPSRLKARSSGASVYPGADYVGRDGKFTYILSVLIGRDGRSVRGFSVQLRNLRCHGAHGYSTVLSRRGAWPIAGGRTSRIAAHTHHASVYDRHGRRIPGREHTEVHIKFAGNHAKGTLKDTFRSRGLSCSSPLVHIATSRVGSPSAPLATHAVVTGTYRGTSRAGRWSFVVYLPLHMVVRDTYPWTLKCPKHKAIKRRSTFYDIPLTKYSGDGELAFHQEIGSVHRYGPRGDHMVKRSSLGSSGILQPKSQTLRHGRVYVTYKTDFSVSAEVQIDQRYSQLAACSGGYDTSGQANRTASFPYR
jgi:hypothetical protein